MPECPECGYDLAGLDLPGNCPECGVRADPVAWHADLERWYSSWRGLLFLLPPSHAALGLCSPKCRRIAVRRLTAFLIIPWLLASAALVAMSGMRIISTVELWTENSRDRSEKSKPSEFETVDGLLELPLELFRRGIGSSIVPRTDWDWRVRTIRRQICWELRMPTGDVGYLLLLPTLYGTIIPACWMLSRMMLRKPVRSSGLALLAPLLTAYSLATLYVLTWSALGFAQGFVESMRVAYYGRILANPYALLGVVPIAVLSAASARTAWLSVRAARPRLRPLPLIAASGVSAIALAAPIAVSYTTLFILVR